MVFATIIHIVVAILAVLAVVAVFGFVLWTYTPEYKGKEGEERIGRLLSQLPKEYIVLDDLVLKTERGTSQIDHVIISTYGVFAIETKNYRGDIYGDDKRNDWTQIIATDVTYSRKWYKTYTYITKNHFYSPIKQSFSHIYAIKENLTEWSRLKVIPIVVFTGSANLSNVSSNNHVVYDFNLLPTIQRYKTACLSETDIHKIVEQLSQKNIRALVDNDAHAFNIASAKKRFNDKIASNICPRCGGTLVRREGKYGSFYGCSNYPNCKFTTR